MKVFITGGTTGIGFELAKLYLEQGDEVGICGRDLTKIPADFSHQRLKAYKVDVTDRDALVRAVDEFVGSGKLDIMIANAGISSGEKLRVPNFDMTRNILNVNIFGVVNAFEAAINHMKKVNKGHIVAVASVAGMAGLPAAGAYCASKSAVLTLCESFNLGLKTIGVNVTAIAPGFIDTPLTQKNKHNMPWIMPASKGAKKIKKAIEKKKALYAFPWQMATVIYFLNRMPRFLYRFLMGLKIADYTKSRARN